MSMININIPITWTKYKFQSYLFSIEENSPSCHGWHVFLIWRKGIQSRYYCLRIVEQTGEREEREMDGLGETNIPPHPHPFNFTEWGYDHLD